MQTVHSKLVLKDLIWAALVVLAISQWFLRIRTMTSIGFPLDYDGFYYLYEFKQRLLFGVGYYHDQSVFFWWGQLIGYVFHLNELQLYHFIVAVTLSLFAIALVIPLRNTSFAYLSPALAYLALQSEPLWFLFYGYLKQALGCALLAWMIVLAYTLPIGRKRTTACLLLSLLAGLVHIWSGLVGVGIFLLLPQVSRKIRLIGFCAILLASLGLANTTNVEQVILNITATSEFGWQDPYLRGLISPVESTQYILYVLAVLICLGSAELLPIKSLLPWYLGLLALLLCVPSWYGKQGYYFRFLISSSPIFLLFFSSFFTQQTSNVRATVSELLITVLVLAAIVLRILLPLSPRPIGPDLQMSSIRDNQVLLKRWIPEQGFVRAPHGVQFRVQYFLERRSARAFPGKKENLPWFEIVTADPEISSCANPHKIKLEEIDQLLCIQLAPHWIIRKMSQLPQ